MGSIDWLFVVGLVVFLVLMSFRTGRYNKTAADFLSANRCAGRYLLGICQGVVGFGAISVVYSWENAYTAGLAPSFWAALGIPVSLFIVLSGFVVYRYRQTRALTMAQFFEMRYSRRFRIFAGILGWFSGIVNFGIFPAIGARFFITMLGFQNHYWQVGGFSINLTLGAVMLVLLALALYFTFIGGQISILTTDFWQGLFTLFVLIGVFGYLWWTYSWTTIGEGLIAASEPGKSLIDPLDIGMQEDFNIWFYLITSFFLVYQIMAWQQQSGYNCSATTAHEAKMSPIVGTFRGYMVGLCMLFVPLVAIAIMHHPEYSELAGKVTEQLSEKYAGDEILQRQMRVPMVVKNILPVGMLGAFVAAVLAFFITTNNTTLHSWGTIFVQDVVMPLRKKPLSPQRHMWLMKVSIFLVAVFIFFFSLLVPIKDYVWMFLQITGAIFMGGAGAVIIGGLYWKKGNTYGAWAALIVGSGLSVTVIVLQSFWEHLPYLSSISEKFPYNGQVMAFWSAVAGIASYVLFSLFTKDRDINMDRLLHRGEFAVQDEEEQIKARVKQEKAVGRFWRMIGVNSHEFTKVDKGLFLYTFLFSCWSAGAFVVLLVLGFSGHMNNDRWLLWWKISILILLGLGCVGSVWIVIGGFMDLKKMYKRLASVERNILDDGRVAGDHLLADEAFVTIEQEGAEIPPDETD